MTERKKLTQRTVEAASIESGRKIIWDTDIKGFGLRVSSSGKKSYIIDYRNSNRQQRRMNLGTAGDVKAEWARKEAKQVLAKVVQGQDPLQQQRSNADKFAAMPTLSEYSEIWLIEAEKTKKPKSLELDHANLKNHIGPALGGKKLNEITRVMLRRFHAGMKSTPYQANRCLALLHTIFNAGIDDKLIDENPATGVSKFKEEKRERIFTANDWHTLNQTMIELVRVGRVRHSTRIMFLLIAMTGARRDEIRCVRWDQVDLQNRVIRLDDSKTGEKNITMPLPAIDLIQSIAKTNNPFVFTGIKNEAPFAGHKRSWQTIRQAAGMPDLRIHDLRHAFLSYGAISGKSLRQLGEIAGHKDAKTTQRYANLSPDARSTVADELGEAVGRMMGLDGGEVVDFKGSK